MEKIQTKRPPLRWAGSKRLLTKTLLAYTPESFGTYIEPMVGSGALFFALAPKRAILTDINPDLIIFYRILRDQPRELCNAIKRLVASKELYFRYRESRPTSNFSKAVRFFYLVRLSWNGLYRVNRDGAFNVPFGGRFPRELIDPDETLAASEILRVAKLWCCDFEKKISDLVRPRDLVYLDPPYPKGASIDDSFSRYSRNGFGIEEHKRLALWAAKLAERGVNVLITEAGRRDIVDLYSKAFYRKYIRTTSLIAADSRFRRNTNEVILTSYQTT